MQSLGIDVNQLEPKNEKKKKKKRFVSLVVANEKMRKQIRRLIVATQRIYLVKGGWLSKFSLYISDIELQSSSENSREERPLLAVTPSTYKMSLFEGS